MKRLFLLLLSASLLLASGKYLSSIALPKIKFIDLSTYECDDSCLQNYLQNEQYFSFLARLDPQKAKEFAPQYARLAKLFRLEPLVPPTSLTIDLVAHQRLRSLTTKLSKALLAYLLAQDADFELHTIIVPDDQSLSSAISPRHFSIVVATIHDRDDIASFPPSGTIFIPTLHRSIVPNAGSNILFGGIDYNAQLASLAPFMGESVAIFYLVDSPLSQAITDAFVQSNSSRVIRTYGLHIADKSAARFIRGNGFLRHASVLFNTPFIKPAMIASQLNYYNIQPPSKFSTQINLNEKFFAMLQPDVRRNFYFASIIDPLPARLDGFAALVGERLDFDWVGFATISGIDAGMGDTNGLTRILEPSFEDGQLRYHHHILRASPFNLQEIGAPRESGEGF